MTYRARFNEETFTATIHSAECSQGKGDTTWTVPDDRTTPMDAARWVYETENFGQRGLAMPRICHCCENRGEP